MNRLECESKIFEKAKEIEQLIMEYNPNNKYFVLFITDEALSFNNDHWGDEEKGKGSGYDAPIDVFTRKGGNINEK